MIIGIFTDTYEPMINGVVISIKTMIKGLRDSGHTVYLIAPSTRLMKYDIKGYEIRIPSVKAIGFDGNRLGSIYPVRIVKKLRQLKFDVVHCHTDFSIGAFGRIFGKMFNIPVVYTYHTMYEDYTNYVSRGIKGLDRIAVRFNTNFSRFCCHTCAELIAPSVKTKLALQKYGVTKRIHIIPTGIDLTAFSNVDLEMVNRIKDKYDIDNKFTALYLGRHSKEKNIEFLINKFRDSDVQLLIGGDGPNNANLRTLARDCSNIKFLGKIPWNEVVNYYNACNIFVTASTSETQGLTVVEALSCSLPVLCVDDPSFNHLINDGYNGYNFTHDFEEKLRLIIDNYEMIKKNTAKSIEQYSLENFTKSIVNVYKSAIITTSTKR